MSNFTKLLERKYGSIRGAQTKLAEDLGVNQSSVSNWISGRNFPNPDLIKKMADLFNVSEQEVRVCLNDEEFTQEVNAVPLTKSNTIQLPILADVPLQKIQKLLGHANIQTTMKYAHLMPNDLVGAVDRLGTLTGGKKGGI